jgi:type IV secretory pathway VirB10-like protein
MNQARIVAILLLLSISLVGCSQPEASEPPSPPAFAVKQEKPKAKPAAPEVKPVPASPVAAPAHPKPAPAPAAVDPEAEKQKQMLAKSQQAYEAMSDSQKAAADRIRQEFETSGIWSLDDDEIDAILGPECLGHTNNGRSC